MVTIITFTLRQVFPSRISKSFSEKHVRGNERFIAHCYITMPMFVPFPKHVIEKVVYKPHIPRITVESS